MTFTKTMNNNKYCRDKGLTHILGLRLGREHG